MHPPLLRPDVSPPSPPRREDDRNLAFAGALLEALVAGGVEGLCLAPGSRSAPLALAATRVAGLRRFVHVDERVAGFFALGLAKASGRPVAVACTSGTAAANLLPAAMEASLARVPLVLLTADRPPELRDWGAPQTVDQVGLFGSHARWAADAPCPEAGAEARRYARALGTRAAHLAVRAPAGPVHLNLPFREPLHPTGPLPERASAARAPARARLTSEGRPTPAQLAALFERVQTARAPVLVCGPEAPDADLAAAVGAFARWSGWPVLAEVASGLRSGPHVEGAAVLGSFPLLLRDAGFAARMAPDLILRVGAPPGTKALAAWRATHPQAEEVVIDAGGGFRDPAHLVDLVLEASPTRLLDGVARRLGGSALDPAWRATWLHAEKRADAARSAVLAGPALHAPRAAAELFAALPAGAGLQLANSMAVRDADLALPVAAKPLRVFASRGANGIDGTLASALGAAAAGVRPLALLTGDLALLHDLGALLEARRHGIDATVVVLNDDGGGIFAHLPVAEALAAQGEGEVYEELFRVRHGLPLGPAVEGLGARHRVAATPEALRAALDETLGAPGLHVVEVPLDAEANRAAHARLAAAVAEALAADRPPGDAPTPEASAPGSGRAGESSHARRATNRRKP